MDLQQADRRPGLYRNVFYTPEEVATILDVSVRTVYRLLESNQLDGTQISQRTYRIYGADLADYLGVEAPVKDNDADTHSMMTVRETATYLRVSRATIYRLARDEEIPAVQVGRSWRFSRALLDEWLDHKMHGQDGLGVMSQ